MNTKMAKCVFFMKSKLNENKIIYVSFKKYPLQ